MKNKILYHGTNAVFSEFSNDYLNTEDSIDQYGSGFYFYDNPSNATLHGGWILECDVTINKSIKIQSMSIKRTVSRDIIQSLICASPYLEDTLENFGDISYLGFDKVFKQTVDQYWKHQGDQIDLLNCIGNDFFQPKDTHLLLSKWVKLGGFDTVYVKERNIYIILTKQQIHIKNVINSEDLP